MDKSREEFEAIARELDLDCEWVDLTGTTVLYGSNGQKKDGCYNDFTTDTAWNFYKEQQAKVDDLQCEVKRLNLWYSNVKLQLENKEIDSAIDAKKIDDLQKDLVDAAEGQMKIYEDNQELQKRVEIALEMAKELRSLNNSSLETYSEVIEETICDLEQALKGEG